MPPTRRSVASRGRMSSRGHPSSRGCPALQGRASSVRGRTRSAATTDLPIPTELPIVNFEDSAEMQQLVGEAGSIGGASRSQWEESVRLRLDRNDHMLTEMHSMLQSVITRTAHVLPPVDVNSPPVDSATVSAAPSAMASAAAGASTAVLPPGTATASAPWPTADTTGTVSGTGLPTVVGARASSFASSSLPMYAHVSSKLRTKIWAGEYVDIASL